MNALRSDANKNTSSPLTNKRIPINQKFNFWLIILIILLIIIGLKYYYAYLNTSSQRAQPLPVVTAKAKTQDVPVYLYALGGVTPTYSITVRTQINGQLMSVLFREGQMVKEGDVLAQIDDRLYLAQLTEFQGQYERDKAQLTNALIDLKRYQTLWKQDSVSQQTLATQEALVKQLQGTLKLDRGLLQTTQVNLIYTKITSPINGRVGLRLVDAGNYVQTSDTTGIAVINVLNPITVIFTIPEDNIPAVLQQMNLNKTMLVEALDREQNKRLAQGKLLTIDNQIDTNTGTVKLRAEFQNENNILFPNQFVNVRLLLKLLHDATVIPTAAIQYNNITKTSFVYVVNTDQTVSVKPINVSVTTDDSTVITSGVSVGQLVVVEGADKLTNGVKVVEASRQPISTQTPSTQTGSTKRQVHS